jgi:hypothetical protein
MLTAAAAPPGHEAGRVAPTEAHQAGALERSAAHKATMDLEDMRRI